MRFINEIVTTPLGEKWTNERLLPAYEEAIESLPEAQQQEVREFVRFQLVGERSRYTVIDRPMELRDFQTRAAAFERGVNAAVSRLADQIVPAATAAEMCFDAIIT